MSNLFEHCRAGVSSAQSTIRKVKRKQTTFALQLKRNFARSADFDPHFSRKIFSCSFFRRKSQRRPRGENDREAAAHLAERSRKTPLIARSFRALGVRRLLLPTFSHRGIKQASGLPRNTIRSVRGCCQSPHRNPFFRKPKACTSALRKARRKWRHRCERPERVCDKRSLSCPLSERRRRHPRLFAVLDLLVLLGQAKSTKKNSCRLSVCTRTGLLFCRLRPARFLALSFEERAKEDREAKMIGKPPRTSLNDHERLRLSHDRSGRSVCSGFFFRHFHIAGAGRSATCQGKNNFARSAPQLPQCTAGGNRADGGSSARSDRAISEVFRARSVRTAVRSRRRCLADTFGATFW